MNNRDKITEIIYKNSTDTSEGLVIRFGKIEGVIDKLNELNKSQDKQIKDLLNWVKSDIATEQNPKLGKTSTPYRREKLKFLHKIEQMLSKPNCV